MRVLTALSTVTLGVTLGVTLVTGAAHAQALNQVQLSDLPGTRGRWQQGQVTVAAPAAEVQRWFSDSSRWAQRFPDDEWARTLGTDPSGRKIAQLKSRALGRVLTLRLREQPGLITYDGSGKSVTTQGRIYIQPLGPRTTRVTMQTSGELHGAIGAFAGEGTKRKKAFAKIGADLNALVRLSNAWARNPRARF